MKIILMHGLPGSGKSTICKKIVEVKSDYVIVNADSIGSMFAGGYENYGKDEEKFKYYRNITNLSIKNIVCALIENNINFILDETLIKKQYRSSWIHFIKSTCELSLIPFEIIIFDLSTNVTDHLSNRMIDSRNIDIDKWQSIISNMKDNYEHIYFDELEEYNKFCTVNRINLFSLTDENIFQNI